MARGTNKREVRSWKESLYAMAKVLHDECIPDDCGVGIEYGIPGSSKRIDMLLSSRNDVGRDNLMIIELKQWESARRTDMDGLVRTRFAEGEANTSHPSYQSWSYAELLRGFNETVDRDQIPLQPCAYLHNCQEAGDLLHPFYAHYVSLAPVFLCGDEERIKLRSFIARHMREGDKGDLIYRIENGRIRPTKRLIDALQGMMAGTQEFVLVDEQKLVFETALARATSASRGPKQVVIVEGGPGTGKSVVAVNLLAAMNSQQRNVRYVSKNRAPRQVIEHTLAGSLRRSVISNLFSGSDSFYKANPDDFDTLVVDEAHRLRAKSGIFANKGEHQVSEIIRAARCSIFFVDEDQRVTWHDVGRREDIAERARMVGASVTTLKLESQFRCSGSDGYLAWLDDVLGIRATVNPLLDTSEYDFRVLDSPQEVRTLIEARNRVNNRARMVAGYCWDWKSQKDSSAMDVVVPEHGFAMQWNLASDEGLWITAPNSVKQIGCIHTSQGLEVDYIGVIIGPDLTTKEGSVQTHPDKRSRMDKSLHGYKKTLASDPEGARSKADAIIRNTYRTLMTRGMKGCYVYCTDPETAAHLRSRLVDLSAMPSDLLDVTPELKVAEDPANYGKPKHGHESSDNSVISTVQVKELDAATEAGEEMGLTEDEKAFYDALAANESALTAMGDDKLKVIAAELITQVRKSVTIDWTLRESARAKIKVMVKRILNRYGYPPDLQDEAVKTVLAQAELLCADWTMSGNA